MAYNFSCANAGATCNWRAAASSQEELLGKVSDHLQRKHRVKHVTKTLQNFALKVAKQQ